MISGSLAKMRKKVKSAWSKLKDYAGLFGLDFNAEKSGSVKILADADAGTIVGDSSFAAGEGAVGFLGPEFQWTFYNPAGAIEPVSEGDEGEFIQSIIPIALDSLV